MVEFNLKITDTISCKTLFDYFGVKLISKLMEGNFIMLLFGSSRTLKLIGFKLNSL